MRLQTTDRAKRQETLHRIAATEAGKQRDIAVKATGLANKNEATAKIRAEQSERTADFLENLFQANDPTSFLSYGFRPAEKSGQELTARDLLDRGGLAIGQELGDQPLVKARMLNLIGRVNRSIGRYDEARKFLEQALAIRESTPDVPDLDLADSLYDLGWISHDIGDYSRSEEMFSRSIALRRKYPAAELEMAQALIMLGWTLTDQRHPDAEGHLQEAIRIRLARLPTGHRDIAIARAVLASYYFNTGQLAKGALLVPYVRAAFAGDQSGAQIEKGMAAFQTGMAFHGFGLYAQAEASMQESIKLARPFLGDDHPLLCIALGQIGHTRQQAGNLEGAEKAYHECLDVMRKSVGIGHPRSLEVMLALEAVLEPRGRLVEIEPLYQEIVAAGKARYGAQHVNRVMPLVYYARVLVRLKRVDEATALAREAMDLFPRTASLRSPDYEKDLSALGAELWKQDRLSEATALFAAAVRQCEAHKPTSYDLWWNVIKQAGTLRERGDLAAATPLYERALRVVRDGKLKSGSAAASHYGLALLAEARPTPASAEIEGHYRMALKAWRLEPTAFTSDQDEVVDKFAARLVGRRDFDGAAHVLRQACELLVLRGDKGQPRLCHRLRQIAVCGAAGGRQTLSDDVRRHCHELLAKTTDREARSNLVGALCLVSDSAAAEELVKKLSDKEPVLLAIALHRAGRSRETELHFQTVAKATDWLYAAQAELASGRAGKANQIVSKVKTWLAAPSPSVPQLTNRQRLLWSMELELDLLLAQTEALLSHEPPSAPGP